jgi:hypothetical protein
MEDDMDIGTIDQRGTKRAVEETESQEPPKPKKIKVTKRACSTPSILSIQILNPT